MLKFLVPFILAICLFSQASACSLFFFGGDYTDDGANLFVRIEDGDLNDENKLYLVSPAGKHKEGEEYHGCLNKITLEISVGHSDFLCHNSSICTKSLNWM